MTDKSVPTATAKSSGDAIVVAFSGHLPHESEEWMREILAQVHDYHMIIDLSEVPNLDDACMAVLVAVLKHCKKSFGELVIMGANTTISGKIELMGLTNEPCCLKLFASLTEAVEHFTPRWLTKLTEAVDDLTPNPLI